MRAPRYEAAEKSAASFDINAVAMCHGIFDIFKFDMPRGARQVGSNRQFGGAGVEVERHVAVAEGGG